MVHFISPFQAKSSNQHVKQDLEIKVRSFFKKVLLSNKTLTQVIKTAYCDTLKNGQFQCKFIPQKSLHLIKYIQFVGKMERLLLENIF